MDELTDVARSLDIPGDGLVEVLTHWVGRGDLISVLAATDREEMPRTWTAAQTRARAEYAMFLELRALIECMPLRLSNWIDLLPTRSSMDQQSAPFPRPGTLWSETLRRYGWPPSSFVVRERTRTADEILVTTLAWVLRSVRALATSASVIDRAAVEQVGRQLAVMDELLAIPPLTAATSERPQSSLLNAVYREGGVWRLVARLAHRLLALDNPAELAHRLLVPAPELRPAFFQLGVLGEVLLGLLDVGGLLTSSAPLGFSVGREHFQVRVNGKTGHVWFEAAGVWTRYGHRSPYTVVSRGLGRTPRALSPDLAVVIPGVDALVLECKYSAAPDYVGRRGLAQAGLYALELTGTVVAKTTTFVVAPSRVVTATASVPVATGRLGLARATDVRTITCDFAAGL